LQHLVIATAIYKILKMVKESEKPQDWYSEYIATYTSEQRKNWYSEIADAYNGIFPPTYLAIQ